MTEPRGNESAYRYGRSDWDLAGSSERERHSQDSFGQQVRDVSHQVARRIKHVFRGPKGYKRSDERIREDVHECLTRQREIDAGDIEVTVSQGEVTLTGTIASRHEKFVAEEIADSVNGVADVHNWLRRRGAPIEDLDQRSALPK